MKILITGATGFIGRNLVAEFLSSAEAECHELHVLLRNPVALDNYAWAKQVSCHQGDLLNEQSLLSACQGCDVVIHLASLAHITNTREEDHWNISYLGAENLLNAALQSGVSRFIFISSIKASEASGASAYAQVKYAFEKRLQTASQQNEISATIIRPAVVYGAGMKGNLTSWINKVKSAQSGLLPGLPASSGSLQMISVEDLAKAIVCASERLNPGTEVITVHDGERYSLRDLERHIYSACHKSGPAFRLPRWCWWLAGKLGDLSFALFGKSIGFSSHSYDTLFDSGEPLDEVSTMLYGFSARQTFYEQLPHIISKEHSDRQLRGF